MKNIKKIHLDHVEAGLLLGLFVLICGMVFTAGVLVGFGIGEKKSHGNSHVSLNEHGKEAVEGHDAQRAPASEVELVPNYQPGDTIKKAFREDKQLALNDLEFSEESKPLSLVDTQAHFKLTEQGRRPASQTNQELSVQSQDQKSENRQPEKSVNKSTVNGLFERSPASKDLFVPVSGMFTIQIASYSTEDEAQSRLRALRESGYTDAFIIPIKTGGGDQWFRVAVGSYKSKDWAKKAGDRIVKRRLASDFIVRQVE